MYEQFAVLIHTKTMTTVVFHVLVLLYVTPVKPSGFTGNDLSHSHSQRNPCPVRENERNSILCSFCCYLPFRLGRAHTEAGELLPALQKGQDVPSTAEGTSDHGRKKIPPKKRFGGIYTSFYFPHRDIHQVQGRWYPKMTRKEHVSIGQGTDSNPGLQTQWLT